MFGISAAEIFIVALFALIIFGPDKVPQFARTAGRIIRQFNKAKDDMTHMIKSEMYASEHGEDLPSIMSPQSPFAADGDQRTAGADVPEYLDDEEDEEEE